MSFKIFSYQLSGKIKPVEKIEMQRELLYNDYVEFNKVASSEELAIFNELNQTIHSEAFKKRKAEIRELHFKDSPEYHQLREYEQLKNSGPVKKYFKLKESEDFRRYEALKDSEKLKEYRKLLDFIQKGEYKKIKDEVKQEVFKGSVEEQQWSEFNKLKKNPGIKAFIELHNSNELTEYKSFSDSEKLKRFNELKNLPEKDKAKKKEFNLLKKDPGIKSFFKFKHSKKYKLYHDALDSYNLKRFNELKEIVENESFKKRVSYLKDKKKFEKTEAHKKYLRFKELEKDSDITFFLKFEKSSLLKNYFDVDDSPKLKRYQELKDIVLSDAFKKRREYLEDPKKWEKTEAYAKEQKYHEMKGLPHLVKYFKYKDTPAFDFFKKWEVAFEDDFSGSRLDIGKWSVKSVWTEKMPGGNFSMPGDLNAFTEGNNIRIDDKLVIETRKEKAKGLIWQVPPGFIPAEFDYTSGLVSSGNNFWHGDGIFEAKIKFNPVKEVVSSFFLQGERHSPRIHLLEMGTKNRIGVSISDNKGKMKVEGLDISNLRKNRWYIFTLQKSGPEFIWKINEKEVLRLKEPKLNFALHLYLLSIVIFKIPGSKLPVRFETDWVRCYRSKSALVE